MKIDLLYPFHFNGVKRKPALNRLKTSIASIITQPVNVCVVNTSKKCIYSEIKNLGPMRYIHKENKGEFSKGLTINFGVRNLIKTSYFLMSDVDLVYHPNYVNYICKYINFSPKRVVPYNYNLQNRTFYSSNYNDYKKLIQNNIKDPYRTFYGIAPGNGLVHRKTFFILRGFNEELTGYNIEDAEFNERCKYVNNYIEDDNPVLRTVHLTHSFDRNSYVNLGHLIWLRKILSIKVGDFDLWCSQFNGEVKQKLYWLQANNGKDWGIIDG